MDLIDRKATLDSIKDMVVKGYALYVLKNAPSVDAVPVVRCGECGKYKMLSNDQTQVLCMGVWHEKNWYCADGEQKEDPREDQSRLAGATGGDGWEDNQITMEELIQDAGAGSL